MASIIYLEQLILSVPRPVATLLDSTGAEFPGGNTCNKIAIPHPMNVEEHHERANLDDAFTQFGVIGQIRKMEVDCYTEACVEAIYYNVGRAATKGEFVLERPGLNNTQAWRHHIRFYYANITSHFEPVFEYRGTGGVQLHRATIENIRVISTERFG